MLEQKYPNLDGEWNVLTQSLIKVSFKVWNTLEMWLTLLFFMLIFTSDINRNRSNR